MAVNRLNVGATNQLLAKASSGQSTNILELQNTAGVTVAGVDASGNPVGGLTAPTAAGKNKIINGDFGIWQRGTSFTNSTAAYNADRFQGYSDASQTYSRQSFTAGTAPVTGYESTYFWRGTKTATGTFISLIQLIEDVRTFANQTFTVSFWAKTDTAQTLYIRPYQQFGTSGSSTVTFTSQTVTTNTSWVRYSATFTAPSIAGKTIGANNHLGFETFIITNGAVTMDIWGIQLEAGAIATPFVLAGGGSQQAELALCQRYYYRVGFPDTSAQYGILAMGGYTDSTTNSNQVFQFPTTMRSAPSSLTTSGTIRILQWGGPFTPSAYSLNAVATTAQNAFVNMTSSGMTGNSFTWSSRNNDVNAFIAFSSEL